MYMYMCVCVCVTHIVCVMFQAVADTNDMYEVCEEKTALLLKSARLISLFTMQHITIRCTTLQYIETHCNGSEQNKPHLSLSFSLLACMRTIHPSRTPSYVHSRQHSRSPLSCYPFSLSLPLTLFADFQFQYLNRHYVHTHTHTYMQNMYIHINTQINSHMFSLTRVCARVCVCVGGHLMHCSESHCNTPQRTTTHCNTLRHTTTHCNALQRTATHCNALQRTATDNTFGWKHHNATVLQTCWWTGTPPKIQI